MSTEIQLLQYNTHLFGGTIPGDLPFDPANLYFEDEERRSAISTKLMRRGLNVVCLEEVWADSYKDAIIADLRRRYPGCYYPKKSDEFKLGSGLLLLTEFDIINKNFHGFTSLVGSDAYSQKGFIACTLGKSKIPLFHLIMTHTQADYNPKAVSARQKNIEQIMQVAKTMSPNLPIVICGDLNVIGESPKGVPTTEYTETLIQFSELNLIDAFRTKHSNSRVSHGFTYNGYRNKLIDRFAPADKTAQQRLDYVFTDAAITQIEVLKTFTYGSPEIGGCDLSDHYPLKTKLTLS